MLRSSSIFSDTRTGTALRTTGSVFFRRDTLLPGYSQVDYVARSNCAELRFLDCLRPRFAKPREPLLFRKFIYPSWTWQLYSYRTIFFMFLLITRHLSNMSVSLVVIGARDSSSNLTDPTISRRIVTRDQRLLMTVALYRITLMQNMQAPYNSYTTLARCYQCPNYVNCHMTPSRTVSPGRMKYDSSDIAVIKSNAPNSTTDLFALN